MIGQTENPTFGTPPSCGTPRPQRGKHLGGIICKAVGKVKCMTQRTGHGVCDTIVLEWTAPHEDVLHPGQEQHTLKDVSLHKAPQHW